jgi:hypothetical protein
MSRLIRYQKKIALLTLSVVLSFVYRLAARVWPSPIGPVRASVDTAKHGLLLRLAPLCTTASNESSQPSYALELNSSFPFFHRHVFSTEALPVSLVYTPYLSERNVAMAFFQQSCPIGASSPQVPRFAPVPVGHSRPGPDSPGPSYVKLVTGQGPSIGNVCIANCNEPVPPPPGNPGPWAGPSGGSGGGGGASPQGCFGQGADSCV